MKCGAPRQVGVIWCDVSAVVGVTWHGYHEGHHPIECRPVRVICHDVNASLMTVHDDVQCLAGAVYRDVNASV